MAASRTHVISRWSIPLLLLVALTALLTGTAMAQDGGAGPDDDQIVLTGELVVPEGETVDTALIFDGDATIDGTVREAVVVFHGSAEISGTVEEDVVVFDGDLTVRSGAEVGGDLVSRSSPTVEDGATVRGEQVGVEARFDAIDLGFEGRFAWWLAYSVSVLVLGLVMLAFGPRLAEALTRTARSRTGASIGWGIGLFLLLPIGAVLVSLTLVGIPLGLSVLFALALIYSVGYVAAAIALGGLILKGPRSRFVVFLLGWAILRVIALVPFLGGLTWLVASAWGLGLLAVAARRSTVEMAGPAMPPPPPPAPVPVA